MLFVVVLLVVTMCFGVSHGTRLVDHLQVDDIDHVKYEYPKHRPSNTCTRPCKKGDVRTCYYRFVLEPYATMGKACGNCSKTNVSDCHSYQCVTADGFEKAILTINRRLPGPSIQVCEGDTIVIDVKNAMSGRSTTIHWHGLRMIGTPFMDGVPMVTQCPILEGQIFRYCFKADRPGLFFYHSHDGLQKVDGLVGAFVIRQPKHEDPNSKLYDLDLPCHVITIQDWYHLVADAMFPGLRFHDTEQMASTFLINGRGQFIMSDEYRMADTPLAEFKVESGLRYVFRIIAGTCFECQYVCTFEGHNFTIIGLDGNSIEPITLDSLTMSSGERCTVVVYCDKPLGAYWIQIRAVGLCNHTRANQVAVLWYKGASHTPKSPAPTFSNSRVNRIGMTLSPVNSPCTEESRRKEGPCLHDLRSAQPVEPKEMLQEKPHIRMVWALGFHFFNRKTLYSKHYYKFLESAFGTVTSTINGITNMASPCPLLSQYEDIPPNIVCPEEGYSPETWNVEHRECVHIMKVPLRKVVEIVIVNIDEHSRNATSHPIHLHGYDFCIMEMGILEQGIPYQEAYLDLMKYLDSKYRKRIPERPLCKDTFALTAGGYIVARIYTDNPGYWYFHCHFAYHLDSGMSGILQVGEIKTFPTPPKNFPKCCDFLTCDIL